MIKCNLCKSTNYRTITREIREGKGHIVECKKCSHVYQAIEMSNKDLEKYYNDIYVITNSLTSDVIEAKHHFDERLKTLDNLLLHLRKHIKKSDKVLDIGAGAGSLLYAIKKDVTSVSATELNKSYVEFMKSSLGINSYYGFIEKIQLHKKFTFIISINTIDHLPNPVLVLENIYKILEVNGKIYLELPNRKEALNFFLPEDNKKKFNKFYWHKAHYSYFSEEILVNLLKKVGFKDISVDYRHEYTILNYLNWYFNGEPQKVFVDATTNTKLFSGDDYFEKKMNGLFSDLNSNFLKLMKKSKRGDTIIVCATK